MGQRDPGENGLNHMKDMTLYHITSREAWLNALAVGSYRADSLESQGFIHCSTARQVIPVAYRFYRAAQGLVLLEIDPAKLGAPVRWENLEGGTDLFPHIYGPLNLDAVSQVLDFIPGGNGEFSWP